MMPTEHLLRYQHLVLRHRKGVEGSGETEMSKDLKAGELLPLVTHVVAAKLSTMPRALDPPERQPWIRHHHGVYERLSGFELLN